MHFCHQRAVVSAGGGNRIIIADERMIGCTLHPRVGIDRGKHAGSGSLDNATINARVALKDRANHAARRRSPIVRLKLKKPHEAAVTLKGRYILDVLPSRRNLGIVGL